MLYVYTAGLAATICLAGFARYDKNYAEMRALLLLASLWLSLAIDKVVG